MKKQFNSLKDLIAWFIDSGLDLYETDRYVWMMIRLYQDHWTLVRRSRKDEHEFLAWSEIAHVYYDKIVLCDFEEGKHRVIERN